MAFERVQEAIRSHLFFVVICSGIFIANLIYYWVVIQAQYRQIDALQNNYALKRKKRTRIVRENEQVKQYNRDKASIEFFRQRLEAKDQFVDRVDELNGFIQKRSVVVDQMEFQPKAIPEMALWRYETSFTATGTYAGLKGFLADIQSSSNLYCVEQLMIMPSANQKGLTDMKMKLAIYFSAKPEEFTQPDAESLSTNGKETIKAEKQGQSG